MCNFLQLRNPAPYAGLILCAVWSASFASGQTWSTPVTLASESVSKIVSPSVGANATGQIVAAWSQKGIVQAAVRLGGVWGISVPLSPSGQTASSVDVAVAGNGDAVITWVEGSPAAIVKAAFYSGGKWGAPSVLSTAGGSGVGPQVGYDGLNQATIAWWEAAATCAVRATTGSAASGWATPVTISTDCDSYVRLAANSRGEAVVVWSTVAPVRGGSPVNAAFRTAGGLWGAPVLIGAATYRQGTPAVALSEKGTALAIWGNAYGVYWSRRASDGSWSAAAALDSINIFAGVTVLASDTSGNAIAAYSIVAYDATGAAVYPLVARKLRSGSNSWGASSTITPPTAITGAAQIAVSPNASYVIAWADSSTGAFGVSTLLSGGGWKRSRIGLADNGVAAAAAQGLGVVLWNRYWTTPSTVNVSTVSIP